MIQVHQVEIDIDIWHIMLIQVHALEIDNDMWYTIQWFTTNGRNTTRTRGQDGFGHTAISHDQLEVPSFKLFTPLGQLTVSHRDT